MRDEKFVCTCTEPRVFLQGWGWGFKNIISQIFLSGFGVSSCSQKHKNVVPEQNMLIQEHFLLYGITETGTVL